MIFRPHGILCAFYAVAITVALYVFDVARQHRSSQRGLLGRLGQVVGFEVLRHWTNQTADSLFKSINIALACC